MDTNITHALEILTSGIAQVLPEGQLEKKLKKGTILKIKLGMDPTAPDLHLGHAVVLSKLRQFQDLGHDVIFLLGDYTALIGDPSGKSKTRPPLTEQEITENAKTYRDQVCKILDPKKTHFRQNSEWLSSLNFADVIKLCGRVTVAQIIERDDFATRLKDGIAVGMHELLYPLMQGYDSVALKADVELGGTDQTFNLLMGRVLQEQYGQEPQVIMTLPILEGLDGVQKMSKSLGNYVGLWEPASEVFGKLMSVSDTLMWRYYLLLGNKTEIEVKQMQADVEAGTKHPMNLKKHMAHLIVTRFWSSGEADQALKQFENLFQKKDLSAATEVELPAGTANPLWIVEMLKQLGAITSSSEARRLIQSNAVSINGEAISDFKTEIAWKSGMVIKVGKHRIYKL